MHERLCRYDNANTNKYEPSEVLNNYSIGYSSPTDEGLDSPERVFAIDNTGKASFAGDLKAADGTFVGDITATGSVSAADFIKIANRNTVRKFRYREKIMLEELKKSVMTLNEKSKVIREENKTLKHAITNLNTLLLSI